MTIYDEVVLTIAIPAYNQAQALRSTLENIAELDFARNNLKLEIIVSDNCSNDSTQSVANGFIEQLPNFRYEKQSENLGFIGNFAYLLQEAKGKYIWFLGCGETILPVSADQLFIELQNSELDIITLGNSDQFINELGKAQKHTEYELVSQRNWGEIPLYDASFACLIFKTQTTKRFLPEIILHGGAWPHVELALKKEIYEFRHPHKLGRYNIPTVNIYRDSDGWWNKRIVFQNLIEIINLLDKYATIAPDPDLRKAIEKGSPKNNLQNLGLWIISAKRASVKPNKLEFQFFWSLIDFRARDSIFFAFALLTPKWILNIFISFTTLIKKPKSNI